MSLNVCINFKLNEFAAQLVFKIFLFFFPSLLGQSYVINYVLNFTEGLLN